MCLESPHPCPTMTRKCSTISKPEFLKTASPFFLDTRRKRSLIWISQNRITSFLKPQVDPLRFRSRTHLELPPPLSQKKLKINSPTALSPSPTPSLLGPRSNSMLRQFVTSILGQRVVSSLRSTSMHSMPWRASCSAQIRPAGPAPMMRMGVV